MKKLLMLALSLFAAGNLIAAEYPDISIDELKSAIADKKVTIIDVNGTGKFTEGHIPGAIDFAAAQGDIAAKLPSDKGALVVAYCGGPQCSAYKAAAKKATELGYTNVKHLVAGRSGWIDAKEPLEK